ncbi:hypothetical protein F4818DRAFT_434037 [Hypoxylon cercidicola]|nr:hypothetical protein F4818DRAFT_434037 [Hypoxylon cercidicola]
MFQRRNVVFIMPEHVPFILSFEIAMFQPTRKRESCFTFQQQRPHSSATGASISAPTSAIIISLASVFLLSVSHSESLGTHLLLQHATGCSLSSILVKYVIVYNSAALRAVYLRCSGLIQTYYLASHWHEEIGDQCEWQHMFHINDIYPAYNIL